MANVFFLIVSLALSFLAMPTCATFTKVSAPSASLLQYGAAEVTHHYLLKTQPTETVQSVELTTNNTEILTDHSITTTPVREGVHNVTVSLFFEEWVGEASMKLIAITTGQNHEHQIKHSVYGMVIYSKAVDGSRTLVSGDEREGAKWGHYTVPDTQATKLYTLTHAPENADTRAVLTARDMLAKSATLLRAKDMRMRDEVLEVRPHAYTTGRATIDVVCPGVQLAGEVFETVLHVSVRDMPPAPVVLVSAQGTAGKSGTVVTGVLQNAVASVQLVINGTVLHAREVEDGRVTFAGERVDAGRYGAGAVKIRSNAGKGVVQGDVVVSEEGKSRASETESGMEMSGGRMRWGMVIAVSVASLLALILVLVALLAYRRHRALQAAFVDGRVEHIARDAYGRGSMHV